MKFLIFILPLLLLESAKGLDNVSETHDKLWLTIESQLEELAKQQEVQRNKMNGLERLLRERGINFTQILNLSNQNDNDPFRFTAIRNIKNGLELLEEFYTQVKTLKITSADKTDLKEVLSNGFKEICGKPTELQKPEQKYCTDHKSELYDFIPVNGTKINFKLRASNDGHIALAYTPVKRNSLYEIVIGGWANKKSIIRRIGEPAILTEVNHSDLLNDRVYLGFWVRWDGNLIRLGFENSETPFLSYKAVNLYQVNYIGIHTGFGSSGSWIFN